MTETKIVVPSGTPSIDTAALKRAVAEYNRVILDGSDYTPFRVDEQIVLSRPGQEVAGINPWATVVEWCGDASNASPFAIECEQYIRLANIMIRPGHFGTEREIVPTGGFAIEIRGGLHPNGRIIHPSYPQLENVWIHRMFNGISACGGIEYRFKRINLRSLRGKHGIRFKGLNKEQALYRAIIDDIVADAGEIENKFIRWIDFNSYSYSLRIDGAALMKGGHGVYMGDDVADGSSYPAWIIANDLECDHNEDTAVVLAGGEGFQCGESWLGSSMKGHGLAAINDWRGDIALSSTRLFGNAMHGILLETGSVAQGDSLLIGDNSAADRARYSGIHLGAKARNARFSGFSGDCIGVDGNNQSYGVSIERGASNFDFSDLDVTGNVFGGYKDRTRFWTRKSLPRHAGPASLWGAIKARF